MPSDELPSIMLTMQWAGPRKLMVWTREARRRGRRLMHWRRLRVKMYWGFVRVDTGGRR